MTITAKGTFNGQEITAQVVVETDMITDSADELAENEKVGHVVAEVDLAADSHPRIG